MYLLCFNFTVVVSIAMSVDGQLAVFLPGTPVFSTNKTDRHVITEILLKVALNTTNQTKSNLYKADFAVFHVNLLYYTHCM
jgi:hypothetical protein